MGLFNFIKDAGEKIFGKKSAQAQVKTEEDPSKLLMQTVTGLGLGIEGLAIDVKDDFATVKGVAKSQQDREKVILVVGNTRGIAQVDDQITVEKPEPEAKMYTVESGDTLGKIAKMHYGSSSKYMVIFKANQPMLKDPDKIYPGQTLRIPPLD